MLASMQRRRSRKRGRSHVVVQTTGHGPVAPDLTRAAGINDEHVRRTVQPTDTSKLAFPCVLDQAQGCIPPGPALARRHRQATGQGRRHHLDPRACRPLRSHPSGPVRPGDATPVMTHASHAPTSHGAVFWTRLCGGLNGFVVNCNCNSTLEHRCIDTHHRPAPPPGGPWCKALRATQHLHTLAHAICATASAHLPQKVKATDQDSTLRIEMARSGGPG